MSYPRGAVLLDARRVAWLDGNDSGNAVGRPDAGAVGKADNKNPLAQKPYNSDRNAGCECDGTTASGRPTPPTPDVFLPGAHAFERFASARLASGAVVDFSIDDVRRRAPTHSPMAVPVILGIPVTVIVPDHYLKAPVSADRLNADGNLYVPPDPGAVTWASQDAAPGRRVRHHHVGGPRQRARDTAKATSSSSPFPSDGSSERPFVV